MSNFSLLLKTAQKSYIMLSYLGYILVKDLENERTLKIPFSMYEVFYKHLILIIDYLSGVSNADFQHMTIFNIENVQIAYNPIEINNIKFIELKQKLDNVTTFELLFDTEFCFSFFKAFTSSILPTLNLKDEEKLMIQILFFENFNWDQVENEIDNNSIISNLLAIKKRHNLNVEISHIYLLIKYYSNIFHLLQKSNNFVLINLQMST